jgi:mannose-6-phosphate isomerase-like protein (cupin superfamily)
MLDSIGAERQGQGGIAVLKSPLYSRRMLHDQRPWGNFTVLDSASDYKVKRIEVLPQKRLSYQKHKHRSEHWMVVVGSARVTINGRDTIVDCGATVDIPAGAAHRIENVGSDVLVFIEIQRGTYFGEDDIERLQDDFGRN